MVSIFNLTYCLHSICHRALCTVVYIQMPLWKRRNKKKLSDNWIMQPSVGMRTRSFGRAKRICLQSLACDSGVCSSYLPMFELYSCNTVQVYFCWFMQSSPLHFYFFLPLNNIMSCTVVHPVDSCTLHPFRSPLFYSCILYALYHFTRTFILRITFLRKSKKECKIYQELVDFIILPLTQILVRILPRSE
jgi:hypothetical protein